jgi:hypothetical protein
MMPRRMLLPSLLLLSLSVGAQKQRNGSSPSDDGCEGSRLLATLSTNEGVDLLSAYGYDWRHPWACTKIKSAWATGATILSFRKVTAQTDDDVTFSVLKVSGLGQIWVIPTGNGMLGASHSENDPHNLAAFNALLRLHKGPVDLAGWLGIGKLYMSILGHKEVVPIKAEKSDADSCGSGDECSVSFSDRPVVSGEPYNKWTLDFTGPTQGNPIVLVDVSIETVHPEK